jgi:signal transduction histidine kinase
MTVARLRLHHRIVLPFALVALVTTSAAAYVALSVATRTMDARVRTLLLNAASVVGRSDLALNPAILRSVQEITGAEVLTYTADGTVLATTFDINQRRDVIAAVQGADRRRVVETGATRTASIALIDCGRPCYVAFQDVEGRPGTVVALVEETAELTTASAAVTRTILYAAAVSLVVMVLVSQAVARRVTAPIQRLVEFARGLSTPGSSARAAAGEDEVGRLAAAFNDMLERLEESQRALVKSEKLGLAGLMAAQVAHDIRNPLSSIKMQTQIVRSRLRRGSDDEASLASVLHDIGQVESVIRDLLELARPGTMTLEPSDLNEVVRDVLRQLGAQFSHRKITVTTDLAGALPLIPLDAGRFQRALINVLVNASDAMPTGGMLGVSTRTVDREQAVEIEVADDGVGIDPAILDRVCDPFVSTKRDGIGLGLANVESVVKSHGGSISLLPRQPKGTRAIIRLPVSTPPAVPDAQSGSRNSDG